MIKRRRSARSRLSRNNAGGYLGHIRPFHPWSVWFRSTEGPMDQAQLQKLLGGAPGTPVPQVGPEDVRAVWKLGQEVEKDHPGVNLGIGAEIFERAYKPGSNIPAVTYRAGMTAMFLRHAPELQDKLDSVFLIAATIPMDWSGSRAPRLPVRL